MINLEKINEVIASLDEVANNLSKISEVKEILDKSANNGIKFLNTIENYDKRTYELKEKVESLISTLDELQENYRLEKEAYDITQSKLNEFSNNVSSLEENTKKSINDFENVVISKLEEYIDLLNKYEEKTSNLDINIKNLIQKLEDIRNDYHKVSTCFEIVDSDLKQFTAKIDLISIENKKNFADINNELNLLKGEINKRYKKLEDDNKILKWFIVIILIITIGLGLANILK